MFSILLKEWPYYRKLFCKSGVEVMMCEKNAVFFDSVNLFVKLYPSGQHMACYNQGT